MTDEKIKKIAREYVREVYNGDTDFIDEAENIIQWLSKDYCIVPKSKVKDEYEVAKSMIHSNKIIDQDCGIVRKLLMDYLFGKDMFKEDKI